MEGFLVALLNQEVDMENNYKSVGVSTPTIAEALMQIAVSLTRLAAAWADYTDFKRNEGLGVEICPDDD